jgi:hypothetical protein
MLRFEEGTERSEICLRQQPGLELNCQAAVLLLRSQVGIIPGLTQLARAQGGVAHPPERERQCPTIFPRVLLPPHPLARASCVSPHLGSVSRLTLAHRPSLTLTHLRPLDQSTHLLRVYFWCLASAAEMGSHDGVVPGLRRRRR